MNKIFTCLLFLFVPFLTIAQSNYKKSQLTQNDGLAVKGYINYREWSQTPVFISFKNNISDKSQSTFNAKNILSFQIDSLESFISYRGKISMDKNAFPDLINVLDTTTKQDTIFLQQITTGPNVTLFLNKDAVKTRYFIVEKNDTPKELIYHEYYNIASNTTSINTYLGQLSMLLTKYNANASRLGNPKFDEQYLEKTIDAINGKSHKKKRGGFVRLFAGIAFNQTKTKFSGASNPWINSGTATNYLPKISIGAEVFDNPNVQKFALRAELSFTAITPKFNRAINYAGKDGYQTYSFNQYNVGFTPQLIYNVYNSQQFKFYLDAGIGINFSAYSNNKITSNIDLGNAYQGNVYSFKTNWLNFPLQAGFSFQKRLEVFFNYTYPTSYTDYSNFSVSSSIYGLGIHYFLNKR
ncbi:MAG: hypothetical protein EOP43_03135 [Sphingobacteriaceae bacterium]|nr:MAG: hypothetical protein EOP43_03135 [Sphingobacteriaceae bacterium]